MSKQRRQFTTEQKLAILEEAGREGITATLRKYNLSNSVYHQWKDKFEIGGRDALMHGSLVLDQELLAVKRENDRLKRIIANQALQLEIKDELLKKSQSLPVSKKR